MAILFIFFLLGGQYYLFDDRAYRAKEIDFSSTEFSGEVVRYEYKLRSQEFDVVLDSGAKVRVYSGVAPKVFYKDRVSLFGEALPLSSNSVRYFEKEGVSATMAFPEVSILGSSDSFLGGLYKFSDLVSARFDRFIGGQAGAFMAGITLGTDSRFSSDLKRKLSLTGTTHIVALSGYNISIIALSISLLASRFLRLRGAFIASVVAICLFVLMTGASASVVRAGIMGMLVLLANQLGRVYSLRNAIAFSAFLMVLVNPKVLVFDLGFQLSFLALIGIVYFSPVIKGVLGFASDKISIVKESLAMTLAAQLAVMPLILFQFGFVPVFSIFANVLILTFIPLTMLLGLFIFLFSFLSAYLAEFFGLLSRIIIGYIFFVIDFFSRFSVQLELGFFSIVFMIASFTGLFMVLYKQRSI
ncbi:MAG: ComEC/Rec2 family competence protein [Candidatus Paceibacterota bacterium]